MNKFITLFVLLASVSVAMSATCLTCVKEGAVCDATANICEEGTVCIKPNSTAANTICFVLPTLNEDCSGPLACADSYYCNTTSKICVEAYYLGVGESCSSENQCSTSLVCTGGKCVNEVYPLCGASNSRVGCKAGEGCAFNGTALVCSPFIANGAACNTSTSGLCHPVSSCSNGVCTAPLTGALNSNCTSNTDCNIANGLYCSSGKCTAVPEALNNCTTTPTVDNCLGYSACMCPSNDDTAKTGSCKDTIEYSDVTSDAYNKYDSCVVSCPAVTIVQKQSCLSKCTNPLAGAANNVCSSATTIAFNAFVVFAIVLSVLLF
uniref:Cell-cell adhesion glycoprotein 64 n=1 Tax=Heterostelium pallidum TaxID=13642 RepID=GP64_HETPA|nr:RecName: Full=Cell-cell adhesion glycoprotein 64; Short=Gp64; AltName: Full=Contact site 1; Flags: Precursor [Heterostelium pallidum]BAA03637.1 gp64 [Heterostelium pallidum]BAA86631.1 gp64 [Heterostelium pallidum]